MTKAKVSKKNIEAPEDLNIPVKDRSVVVGDHTFVAENAEKWDRAVNGTVINKGELLGGIGKDASPAAKLAAYDRLGGYITCAGRKIKTGAFFDFKENAPAANPEPVFLFRVEGEDVEVPVGAQLPIEVQASELASKKKADKGSEKKGKKAQPSVEDEE